MTTKTKPFKNFKAIRSADLGGWVAQFESEYLTDSGEVTDDAEKAGVWPQDYMARDLIEKYWYPVIAIERSDITGWVCQKCKRYWGESEHMARYCCTQRRLCDCGNVSKKHYTHCTNCSSKKAFEKLQKRVEEATKMTIEDVRAIDCLFIEDDRYGFDGPEELIASSYEGEPECLDFPIYIWATNRVPFSLNLDSSIQNECDEHHEDMHDCLGGIEELEKAVEKFNETNKDRCSFYPDYSRVLVVTSFEPFAIESGQNLDECMANARESMNDHCGWNQGRPPQEDRS